MSKAKKIISMLLAVAMVLTVAPVSMVASAATLTSYGELSFSQVQFTVDTTATTEVIRIAKATGSFSVPEAGTAGVIVAATPSGIPSSSGTYASVSYAGETPTKPKVVMSITGAAPSEPPTPSSNLSSCTFSSVTTTKSGSTTTYTWEITDGSAVLGTDVVFTLDYEINGEPYQSKAYSHVEHILVMNGFVTYKDNDNGSNGRGRHSLIAQIQSHNMYTGRGDTAVSNRAVGYINYATTSPLSGNALLGCGSEEDLDGSVNAYGAVAPSGDIPGDEVAALIKAVSKSTGPQRNMCYNDDSNRGESVIYMDRRTDTVESINLRLTIQNAEGSDFGTAYIQNMYLYTGHQTFGDEDTSFAASTVPTGVLAVKSHAATPDGTFKGSNTITSSNSYGYVMTSFTGTGPTTVSDSEQEYSTIVNLYSNANDRTNRTAAGININFRVYDTSDLYGMYMGAQRGTGTYTCTTTAYAGTVITFNKGVNPQKTMYTDGWDAYETALDAAGKILVKPDATQAEIDTAALNLYVAYNGLTGYNANVTYRVEHRDNTTGQIIKDDSGNELVQTGTKAAGTTMVARPATIVGYTVTENVAKTKYFSGLNLTETVTYYYDPIKRNVNAYTNTYDENGQQIVNIYPYAYGSTVDLDDLDYGTKENFTFDGWYYDNATFANKATDFTVGASNVTLYAKWVTTPIQINCIPVTEGGVQLGMINLGQVSPSDDPLVTVPFARPADPDVEGYLFVDFYEDAALTKQVSWPLRFTLGDADKTIYARMVDVNGKIIFESNGGTAVANKTFTAGSSVSAPANPTRVGYTFDKWYYDRELTQAITWPVSMADATGFIAYAGWTPNKVNITFDLGEATTKYDTETSEMPVIIGDADSIIPESEYPFEPIKFGYIFDGWMLDGVRYEFEGASFPLNDIVLTPVWRETEYSAFIDITSYEKLSGEYVEATSASVGDVVTFRMTTLTNFSTGSSVFVFMYDKNFFELVNEGAAAFVLNENNEYVSGINAKIQGVTNSDSLPWPAGLDSTNYAAMMVTIDPTVALDNYNCEPMSDGEWLVEFQLKVKDTATGSGTVYMDNAWTRTPNNIMGTMFYGWAESSNTNVIDTQNSVVVPNLDDATATITLDETVPAERSLILNANGGAWSDGSTANLTYTGREGTEILDDAVPTREGVATTILGYTAPTREGYTLAGWVKSDDETVTWAEGYYATEATDGYEYVAQWTPIEYQVTFYVNDEIYNQVMVPYGTLIPAPKEPTMQGYKFAGWVDAENNAFDIATDTCPLNGIDLYETWEPATDTVYKIQVTYVNNANGNTTTPTPTSYTGTTGYTVKIVEAAPATPEANTIYITLDMLPTIANGNYILDESTIPESGIVDEGVIAADGSLILNVTYCGKPVTFTYDANGGAYADSTTSKPETKEFNMTAAGPGEEPVRAGYTFVGWASSATATSANLTLGTTRMARDATYYAVWTAAKIPAHFDANGGTFSDGTTVMSTTVANGSAITAPGTPSKAGYDFLGWATTADATAAEDLGTMDSTDTVNGKTFYAVYALTDYTVTYYVDGTEQYADTYNMGDTVTLRDEPTKTGYAFSGWLVDGEALEGNTFTMGAADVVVEGTFTANNYDVIFDAAGGYFDGDTAVTTKAVPVAFNNAISAPTVQPTRNGYKFLGWTDTKGSTTITTNYGILTTTETVTFYAVWEATVADYTVEFYKMETDGVTYTKDDTMTETLSGLVATQAPTYQPAAISGFTVDESLSVLSGTIDADNPLVLKVYYSRNQYTVTWNVDGTTTDVKYYYEAAVSQPDDPSKTGYTFAGWTPAVVTTMGAADVTYTASWTANNYQVTFYTDDTKTATVYDASLAYGQEYNVPTATKEGHTFAGWADASTGTVVTLAAIEKVPANDVAYYATWTVNEYVLTYRTYNGIYIQENVPYGTALTAPEAPTREGYTFTGWNGTIPVTMPAQNVTLVAQWSINSYTVTWDVDGVTSTETYEYGAEITKKAAPTKEGYTFAAWEGYTDGMTMPAGDTTFKATWTVNQYDVTWDVDGETTTNTYDYGATITVPSDPAKEGHTFAGWTPTVVTTMGAADVTYTATWTVNEYNVTWDVDGATTTNKHAYGTEITVPSDPAKEGHTFAGWTPEVVTTMGAADVTYTATWTVNNYTVTWDVDGVTSTETYAYGAEIAEKAAPTKEGHTFAAWEGYTDGMTMPAADTTFKATWTVNSYDVTWVVDDESTTDTYAYGATITVPENPTKEGHTFAGWTPEVVTTMGAADVTYTATWTTNEYTVTWDVDGVTTTDTYAYGATIVAPDDPEKEGHTFASWEGYTEGDTMGASNVTFKAVWDVNTYSVTWDVDGETTTNTHAYGTEITVPSDPTKEGHTFAGWTPEVVTTMGAADVTYTATWTVNEYTVTWSIDGEETAVTYAYGAAITVLDNPAKEHYTFEGWEWTKTADGEVIAAVATMPAYNVTITALFERVPVTLTLVADTAVVDNNTNGTIVPGTEDNEDGPVYVTGYIYGLETKISESTLLAKYLSVEGDGRLEVTATKYNVCGTGTKVEVIDNVTDEVVETYYLVVFGDTNGDSSISALDSSMISSEAIGMTGWSTYGTDAEAYAKVLAADLAGTGDETVTTKGDGRITTNDESLVVDVTLRMAEINQQTGEVTYY